MAEKFTGVSIKKINETLQQAGVRAKLRARAERGLPMARAAAYSAGAPGFAKALRVEAGSRPGTKSPIGLVRPYARIIADTDDKMDRMDARAKLTRQQILRRAL